MPQLRSYAGYSKVAPYVPFAFPVKLSTIDGNSAAAGWFQVHDLAAAASLVSGTTVPLKSFRVAAAGPIPSMYEVLGPITLYNGLCLTMSSTEAVYTAVATSFDVFGEVDEYDPLDNTVGTTVVGDTVTGVDSLTVWANGATTQGLHQLMRVLMTNGNAAVRYLMLFAHSPSDGDVPLQIFKFTASQVRTLNFGDSGFTPFAKTAASVLRDGCYLAISTTGNVLTSTSDGNNFIKTWYLA